MKILAFAGSDSSTSINKQLATYTTSLFSGAEVKILDLKDFEMPIYSIDRELKDGIPHRPNFGNKNIFLMATSPGERGGASVLEAAENRFPYSGANIIETFSLPSFQKSFNEEKGIIDSKKNLELLAKVEKIAAMYP